MALANITRRDAVIGNKRLIDLKLDIGADADTYVTGLKYIEAASVDSATNNAIGWDQSANGTIRFQTAGAETDAHAIIIGV